MPSLDETFDQLLKHLRQPELLNPAHSDPFFYFVHDPAETLAVKQKLPVWSSFLANEGWAVERCRWPGCSGTRWIPPAAGTTG